MPEVSTNDIPFNHTARPASQGDPESSSENRVNQIIEELTSRRRPVPSLPRQSPLPKIFFIICLVGLIVWALIGSFQNSSKTLNNKEELLKDTTSNNYPSNMGLADRRALVEEIEEKVQNSGKVDQVIKHNSYVVDGTISGGSNGERDGSGEYWGFRMIADNKIEYKFMGNNTSITYFRLNGKNLKWRNGVDHLLAGCRVKVYFDKKDLDHFNHCANLKCDNGPQPKGVDIFI